MKGSITRRLKQIRRQRKLTQDRMSDLLGLNRNTYAHYERGSRQPPIEQLVNIVARLGISLDYLTGITEYALTVDSAVKFGALKKIRAIREEDLQPYTIHKFSPPKVAENPPDNCGDGYNTKR